jgi:hypothetical protein
VRQIQMIQNCYSIFQGISHLKLLNHNNVFRHRNENFPNWNMNKQTTSTHSFILRIRCSWIKKGKKENSFQFLTILIVWFPKFNCENFTHNELLLIRQFIRKKIHFETRRKIMCFDDQNDFKFAIKCFKRYFLHLGYWVKSNLEK